MEVISTILRRVRHYRPDPNEGGFWRLFIAKRIINGVAAALLGIFVPIFIYEITGEQFWAVGLWYASISLGFLLLMVPAMWGLNHLGFTRSLVASSVVNMGVFTVMYTLTTEFAWWLLALLAALVLTFRLLHWIPYHVDFALFTSPKKRGRQVSLTFATVALLGVIGPVVAGYIISAAGYQTLFLIVIALMALSAFAYARIPDLHTHYSWNYRETWETLLSPERRSLVLGEVANGVETAVSIVVWPIFLYDIFAGNVLEVGAVSTVIVGATIALQLLSGRHLDKTTDAKVHTLRVGSWLYALGWIGKMFVLSTLQVFVIGLYHNVMRIFTKTPFSAIVYDISAEQGELVDEITVVREMALHLGRVLGLVAVALLSLLMPIGWTFVLAAAASVALNLVYRLPARTTVTTV